VRGQCLLAKLGRTFFNMNDILKQKRIAGSERMRRNLKYAEGKRSKRFKA